MSRFVITEVRGYREAGTTGKPGLSTHVLDTRNCHRIIGSWRTEDYGGSLERRYSIVRHRAACFLAALNGEPKPAPPRNYFYGVFQPTCPKCGDKCDPKAARCSCGANLYRRERAR